MLTCPISSKPSNWPNNSIKVLWISLSEEEPSENLLPPMASISSMKMMQGWWDLPVTRLHLPSVLIHFSDHSSRFANVLVDDSWSHHFHEVGLHVASQHSAVKTSLPGQKSLSCSRRPVKQDSFWRLDSNSFEELWVTDRQLDGLSQNLDLVVESSDVFVGHVAWVFGQHFVHSWVHFSFQSLGSFSKVLSWWSMWTSPRSLGFQPSTSTYRSAAGLPPRTSVRSMLSPSLQSQNQFSKNFKNFRCLHFSPPSCSFKTSPIIWPTLWMAFSQSSVLSYSFCMSNFLNLADFVNALFTLFDFLLQLVVRSLLWTVLGQ